ncbi:MAG: homoserine dehydrogenase [Deltaproteobacteria bacterium]|nr:homoserine dehydrogenase [Deltaproteobacteria bacterium]
MGNQHRVSAALRVQVVGFGVVGRGVAKVLSGASTRGRGAEHFRVVAVTDRSGTVFHDDGVDLGLLVVAKEAHGSLEAAKLPGFVRWDGEAAIRNARADIVVEVTPTNVVDGEPGVTHIAEALRAGRAVVTANKGPLALRFGELHRLAERAGVALKYGGSVCGAVPILEVCRDALVGNVVSCVRGVVNGSTNYILSQMERTGQDFDEVLAEAARLGITETDPSQDIDGWDAAVKLVILANAVMGRSVTLRDVKVQGIRGVTAAQVADARARGKVVRLIGEVSATEITVAPTELDATSPLAVHGTLNVAVVETDLARDISLIGRGAGQLETASAILADLHAIRRERELTATAPRSASRSSVGEVHAEALASRPVLALTPTDTVGVAVALLREKGISQLPVFEDGVCVGALHESAVMDLLLQGSAAELSALPVGEVMGPPLPELGPQTPLVVVARILERRPAVLVARGLDILGIITKADLLRLVSA